MDRSSIVEARDPIPATALNDHVEHARNDAGEFLVVTESRLG